MFKQQSLVNTFFFLLLVFLVSSCEDTNSVGVRCFSGGKLIVDTCTNNHVTTSDGSVRFRSDDVFLHIHADCIIDKRSDTLCPGSQNTALTNEPLKSR